MFKDIVIFPGRGEMARGENYYSTVERMYVNKHCVFHCSKSKNIHGGTPVQTIMYISITKALCTLIAHIHYFL